MLIPPPGYRFDPTDVELVVHYLEKKLLNQELGCGRIHVVELYEHTPQELIDRFKVSSEKDVFILTQRTGSSRRMKRTTKGEVGYWKITGSETPIIDDDGQVVGKKASLVYYNGKGKNGDKTNYIMHQLKKNVGPNQKEAAWVICKIHDNTKIKDENQVRSDTLSLPPLQQSHQLNTKRPRLNPNNQYSEINTCPLTPCQPTASSFSPPIEQPFPTISAHPSFSHVTINPSIPSTSNSTPLAPLMSIDTILEKEFNSTSLVSHVLSDFNTNCDLPFDFIPTISGAPSSYDITVDPKPVPSDFNTNCDLPFDSIPTISGAPSSYDITVDPTPVPSNFNTNSNLPFDYIPTISGTPSSYDITVDPTHVPSDFNTNCDLPFDSIPTISSAPSSYDITVDPSIPYTSTTITPAPLMDDTILEECPILSPSMTSILEYHEPDVQWGTIDSMEFPLLVPDEEDLFLNVELWDK